jgi:hypothetical protein
VEDEDLGSSSEDSYVSDYEDEGTQKVKGFKWRDETNDKEGRKDKDSIAPVVVKRKRPGCRSVMTSGQSLVDDIPLVDRVQDNAQVFDNGSTRNRSMTSGQSLVDEVQPSSQQALQPESLLRVEEYRVHSYMDSREQEEGEKEMENERDMARARRKLKQDLGEMLQSVAQAVSATADVQQTNAASTMTQSTNYHGHACGIGVLVEQSGCRLYTLCA